MPRFKPLLLWEPFPYLVFIVLLLATGFVRPSSPPWLLWPLMALLAAALVYLVIMINRERRLRNPDAWGNVADLGELRLVDAPAAERGVRTVVPVDDAHRHQAGIELARLHGGAEQEAVLVPRASRWLSPRYRIGVQLVGGDRPRHAGFLRPDAQERWGGLLDGLRGDGDYVRVPAFVTGASRPFGVELDLSGLEQVAAARR
ncbi:hypothetical protein ACGGZK_15370 [Agromyces sp. MMS24-K17]|uniref:hypothetical protein n=1 Tax=Agromyces sp. MMS24-K17 TaxID=3372850 RepID=UPI003754599E